MAIKIFGYELTKNELMKRIGDISQVAGAKVYELTDGKARGVRAVDFKTGSGFRFTVLPDRGMDIVWAEYKGIPLDWVSKTGVVSANFFEEPGLGFLRSFFGGLVTTCGLTYAGAPCTDEGEELGLHGRISNIPAKDLSVVNEWNGDDFVMKARGKVVQSKVFGENLVLDRTVCTRLGDNRLHIKDRIENCGFDTQPFMILYHMNFGYPVVSSNSRLITCAKEVVPRDDEAKKGIDNYARFEDPIHGYAEQVFYHRQKPVDGKYTYAGLINDKIALGVYIRYNMDVLDNLIEWKNVGEGDYVVGLEPANCTPEGRNKERARGNLKYIKPGEVVEIDIEFGVLTCKEAIDKFESKTIV